MAPSSRPRPTSVSTSNSLMQDVPGSFPTPRPFDTEELDDADEENESREITYQSLSSAIFARRAEYVRPKHVRIKIGTWNVAGLKGTEKDLRAWFVEGKGVAEELAGLKVDGGVPQREDVDTQESRFKENEETVPRGDTGTLPGNADVGLYVLGLQEIVDLGSAMEALRPFTDPTVSNRWKEAVAEALPAGYQLIAEQQLIGLMLLIYAAPDLMPEIKSVSTTSVGTGLMNFMGNKGAVTARIVLGETTRLVFVNCHLAAGADKTALERRNWDYGQIVSRTRFEPISDAMDLAQTTGERIGEEDFAFWFGDLNYRLTSIPGDDVRRLLMLHTRNEYDLSQSSAKKIEHQIQEATDSAHRHMRAPSDMTASSMSDNSSFRSSVDTRRSMASTRPSTIWDEIESSQDPASLQTTLESLLPHDELRQQMKARKSFHDGWREGPVTFLPTYKYDVGSVGVFDSSEKKRAPSWCDRILFRTRTDKMNYDTKIREEEAARKKDEEMKANGTVEAANDESILYDYDPETDGAEGNYDEYDENEDVNDYNGEVTTREGFEDQIELEYYTAHQRVLSSDHKPLDAIFMLKYDAVVPELKAKVHAEVAKELDKAENEGRPNVTVVVDSQKDRPVEGYEGVWFGEIRWGQTKYRSLTIANTSRVAASFSFIERPVDDAHTSGIAPKWLEFKINDEVQTNTASTSPTVTLEPGETASIELSIGVSNASDVQELNNGKSLEDILVMRVENGRDHFIPVRATWLQSSLGRSIDRLIRIPEGGIRKLQRQRPVAKKGDTTQPKISPESPSSPARTSTDTNKEVDDPVRFSAPRELFRLTEAVEELATRVIAEWEMTNPSSSPISRESLERFSTELEAPPWVGVPAWPFEESAWKEREASHWHEALSEACNALDEDRPLEPALPSDMPRLQKLYILSSLLLVFLRSMPEGIVTADLWTQIEAYLIENEKKSKRPIGLDDQRTAIQEILAQKSPNSITFVLVTSMLERIIMEIPADATMEVDDPMSPPPLSPTQKLKRITTFKNPSTPSQSVVNTKQLATTALAKLFAEAMISTSPSGGGEKARNTLERRKTELVEMFLKRDG